MNGASTNLGQIFNIVCCITYHGDKAHMLGPFSAREGHIDLANARRLRHDILRLRLPGVKQHNIRRSKWRDYELELWWMDVKRASPLEKNITVCFEKHITQEVLNDLQMTSIEAYFLPHQFNELPKRWPSRYYFGRSPSVPVLSPVRWDDSSRHVHQPLSPEGNSSIASTPKGHDASHQFSPMQTDLNEPMTASSTTSYSLITPTSPPTRYYDVAEQKLQPQKRTAHLDLSLARLHDTELGSSQHSPTTAQYTPASPQHYTAKCTQGIAATTQHCNIARIQELEQQLSKNKLILERRSKRLKKKGAEHKALQKRASAKIREYRRLLRTVQGHEIPKDTAQHNHPDSPSTTDRAYIQLLQSALEREQTAHKQLEAQLQAERIAHANAISDIRAEQRAPFVAPSLLDALISLSAMAREVTSTHA